MPPHVVAHVAAPGLDLETVALRVREGGADDLRRDSAITDRGWNLGVMDAHHIADPRIGGDAEPARDGRLESTRGRVVVMS